ncbi:MAG: hypothetical protein GC151_18225 [Betaproteobacteria bacterium]|nr:hypothetical protein [Betaproteobacteria bacterium]
MGGRAGREAGVSPPTFPPPRGGGGKVAHSPEPRTPSPEPRTPNPEPRTPNPEPRTPNPEPEFRCSRASSSPIAARSPAA